MTVEVQLDPPDDLEPELFPVVMIYLTGKLDVGRGWNVTLSVQTADGKNVIQRWSTAGGSLGHGEAKMISQLETAYQLALNAMQSFA